MTSEIKAFFVSKPTLGKERNKDTLLTGDKKAPRSPPPSNAQPNAKRARTEAPPRRASTEPAAPPKVVKPPVKKTQPSAAASPDPQSQPNNKPHPELVKAVYDQVIQSRAILNAQLVDDLLQHVTRQNQERNQAAKEFNQHVNGLMHAMRESTAGHVDQVLDKLSKQYLQHNKVLVDRLTEMHKQFLQEFAASAFAGRSAASQENEEMEQEEEVEHEENEEQDEAEQQHQQHDAEAGAEVEAEHDEDGEAEYSQQPQEASTTAVDDNEEFEY